MTLLDRTSIHLNKSLTILKKTFYEIAQAQFLSVKFDNVLITFFVTNEPSCFARNNSHGVGIWAKRPLRKPKLCVAQQTRPKKESGS